MGTNYYLLKKARFTPSPGVEYFQDDGIPFQLENGWVWESKYYPTLESLNEEFVDKFHIGKASYGWRFLLCSYKEHGINNIEDWKNLFNEENVVIEDEYGEVVSVDEMLKTITERKKPLSGFEKRAHIPAEDTFNTYEITHDPDFS